MKPRKPKPLKIEGDIIAECRLAGFRDSDRHQPAIVVYGPIAYYPGSPAPLAFAEWMPKAHAWLMSREIKENCQ